MISLLYLTLVLTILSLPPSCLAQNYTNPILWQDLADTDIIRVGSTFYYSASTMHFSPGAVILQSQDLVNWEYAGHSVPVLDFSAAHDLADGQQAYVQGIWASFLNHRASDGLFYWGGCIRNVGTFVYTASTVAGPWTKHGPLAGGQCYYDAGLLIDEDDSLYVAYGSTQLSVAQVSIDPATGSFTELQSQVVFDTPSDIGALEGSRFYKRNGSYYIFVTRPPDAQYILRSTTGPFGPYTVRNVIDRSASPVPDTGSPHQGGLVETQSGDWYYMAFVDAYPGGRIPVLAPATWDEDGWVHIEQTGNTWRDSYAYPNLTPQTVRPAAGIDEFPGPALSPEWEWNHNPDNARWLLDRGLQLSTATVTQDLYRARNTLTRRIHGPSSTATLELDYSDLRDGDRAGLCLLRNKSAWIGLQRDGDVVSVVVKRNINMEDGTWETIDTGSEEASIVVPAAEQKKIWIRVAADIRPLASVNGQFSYSTDNVQYVPLGSGFVMDKTWPFFMGYRFGVFNYATRELGGSVRVNWFELSTP